MFPLHCQLSNIGDLDEDTGTRGKVADTHCEDILECVGVVCVCVCVHVCVGVVCVCRGKQGNYIQQPVLSESRQSDTQVNIYRSLLP